MCYAFSLILFTMSACVFGLDFKFNTDPDSAELQGLAKPLVVDESLYGCGPLKEPGVTYHVALAGNDAADGRTPQTAWRHIKHALQQLKPGDTLLIGEGEYSEPDLVLGEKHPLCGKPGRPITIAAAPYQRVEITTSLIPKLTRTAGTPFTWEATLHTAKPGMTAWETDTLIALQEVDSLRSVNEIPGTFCFIPDTRKVHVHFADSRGGDVHSVAIQLGDPSVTVLGRGPRGWDVCGSYLRFRGLRFKHQGTAMVIQGRSLKTTETAETSTNTAVGGDHITVEDCSFYSTHFAGLVLYTEARFNLIRNCYGTRNGGRGHVLINAKTTRDNLITGNLFENSAPTVREGGWRYYYGVCNYGHTAPNRNRVLNNIMDDALSFRTKFMSPNFVIQGNIMTGSVTVYPVTYYDFSYEPEERVVFRNNVILGKMSTCNHPLGPDGPAGNWAGPFKVSINNFAAAPKETRSAAISRARFADPAHRDYRLQSDSPLIGNALGGGNIGAFLREAERILYVGPEGDDQAAGTAVTGAWRTLARAAQALRAGDTLYILPGIYKEPLLLSNSGTLTQPIRIRAHAKKETLIPGITVRSAHTTLEGLTVTAGIRVETMATTIKDCLIRSHADGPGILATDAAQGLAVEHCTIVDNALGLQLSPDLANTSVRDSIVAFNRGACVEDAPDSMLISHSCWHGSGAQDIVARNPWRCVAGDPKFGNRKKSDYRLLWDSPAAHLAGYGKAAGCRKALAKTPAVENVQVLNLRPDSAVVAWTTPTDDTTGSARFRGGAITRWRTVASPVQGTIHGASLAGLTPGTKYTFQIDAKGIRGGTKRTEEATFTTPVDAPAPRQLYVAPTGNDTADGCSPETAWQTLRKACFEAGAGDTVNVTPGRYAEILSPFGNGAEGAPLVFRSEQPLQAIVDGGLVRASFCVILAKQHVVIDGFLFERSRRAGGGRGLFQVRSCRNVSFLNCRIGGKRPEGGYSVCFAMHGCRDCRLEGNVIWGTRYHVTAYSCPGLLIKNNTFAKGQVFSLMFSGDHQGTRIVNNLLYYPTSVPNAAISIGWKEEQLQLTSDHNLWGPMVARTQVAYAHRGNILDLTLTGETLDAWRTQSSQDVHSIQTDTPGLVAPDRGDFRLLGSSPAINAGEDGANIGACPSLALYVTGQTLLGPGEGRTIRLKANLHGTIPENSTFQWTLPGNESREGRTLEYTLPTEVDQATITVTIPGRQDETVSIPVAACPQPLSDLTDAIRIEAEEFVDQGGGEVLIYDKHVNSSGKSVANWYGSIGHWLEWEAEIPRDGNYDIILKYASRTSGRTRSLRIDGEIPGDDYREITFEATGGWSTSVDNWRFKKLGSPIALKAGTHRIRMTCLDGKAINADYLVIVPAAP